MIPPEVYTIQEKGSASSIGFGILILLLCVGLIGVFIYYRGEVERLKSDKESLNSDYQVLKENYSELKVEYGNLEEETAEINAKYENLTQKFRKIKSEIEKLKSGSKYELHDPTLAELKQFIRDDKTDEKEYDEKDYDCTDYSAEVLLNAQKRGIRGALIELETTTLFKNGEQKPSGHNVVGFETLDEGLIYVEPQHDVIIEELEIGDYYWREVEKNSDLKFKEWPKLRIEHITIAW